MSRFRAGQRVTLATMGGPQPGRVVDGRPSAIGLIKVRRIYLTRVQKNGVRLPTTYGAVIAFHVSDITPGWPA